jgi:GAF domain-containing protein
MPVDLQSVIQNVSRLAALQRLGVLDTAPEQGFDRLSRIACRMLRAPIALVSFVDRNRQFFKSCVGLPEPFASTRQTPLSHSFCQHVVGSGRPLVIEDARSNPLVRTNPAVAELGIVAYAGIPLVTSGGQTVGSFCVIDHRPRAWSFDDIEALQEIAACVMQEIESRMVLRDSEARCRELEARLRDRDRDAAPHRLS